MINTGKELRISKMDTAQQSMQLFVAINLFVIGLSHFVQPKIWIEFFQFLYKKGNVGNIFNALLSLGMGSVIVSFHFYWKWPIVLVTIYGVLLLLKGLIYLIVPLVGVKSIGTINNSSRKFKWVGLIMCALSVFLMFNLLVESH